MKLKTVKLENFRSYKDEVVIDFNDFTAFVGKNDIGKSTILEALDIFFNEGKGSVKLDDDDFNKTAISEKNKKIKISVSFEDLPTNIIIDSTNETTLQADYLLNSQNQLELIKSFTSSGKPKVFVKANHPTNSNCNNLLDKKDSDLRKIIDDLNIECSDRNKKAIMRAAIWNHYGTDLQLNEIEIEINKDKIHTYLPLYTLFQSDRKNSDGDSEIQDPLKDAVKQILKENQIQQKLDEVADVVQTKLEEVATRTLNKIQEMNPEIASSLNPVIPPANSLKWNDVFKSVSITGDEEIPINKRGSGIKRLILLNFFRAEAERRQEEDDFPSIIYAIEEPETSQHTENQKQLTRAFLELSKAANTQIIITTHSGVIVKELDFEHIRLISLENNLKKVSPISPGELPYPSLNEVNYLAFSEVTEEYHNELYGHIEQEGKLDNFKTDKPLIQYIRLSNNGTTRNEQKTLTEYIRHQIHHPENTHNPRYTPNQLSESINLMRAFINTITTTSSP